MSINKKIQECGAGCCEKGKCTVELVGYNVLLGISSAEVTGQKDLYSLRNLQRSTIFWTL